MQTVRKLGRGLVTWGVGAALALVATASLAADSDADAPNAINTSELVIKDDRLLRIEREPWVDEEVLSRTSVRKIGYGTTDFVNIVKTSTGTYSSDVIGSPHVSYPGVHTTEIGRFGHWHARFLSHGLWVSLPLKRHSSFVSIGQAIPRSTPAALAAPAYGRRASCPAESQFEILL